MEQLITVHYGELALKGMNRGEFEKLLMQNIAKALEHEKYLEIEKKQLRLLIHLSGDSDAASILEKLKRVFGISWFSYAVSCKPDLEIITHTVLENTKTHKEKTVKVDARRADKQFPLTSQEINKHVGEALYNTGFKIDVKNPGLRINIEILKNRANIFFDKVAGLRGLPVGSGGRVLCLFSGGIDSPVAAWLMMKRGCTVDYLHLHPFASRSKSVENQDFLHPFASSTEVRESKIPALIKTLNGFSQRQSKLFILPYTELYKKTFEIGDKSELVIFRRFIFRLANEIARQEGYLGIITGDNLAQVASQTLDNLHVTNEASKLSVYRPVLTYDKEEIINVAKKIGTYEISIKPYRDCCSLVAARHPATRVKLEDAKAIEEKISMEEIVEKTMKEQEVLVI